MKLIKQEDIYELLKKTCKVEYRDYGTNATTNYNYTDKQEALKIVFYVPTISKDEFAELNVKGLSKDEIEEIFIKVVQSLGQDECDLFSIYSNEPFLLLESAYQMAASHFKELFYYENRGLANDLLLYSKEGVVSKYEKVERDRGLLNSAKELFNKNM